MLALIQRVQNAEVRVEDKVLSRIQAGICVFLGVRHDDTSADIDYLVRRINSLRFFAASEGKFSLGLKDYPQEQRPEILIVSQFTLYADLKKGSKPSFTKAMEPLKAKELYLEFCTSLRALGYTVKEGEFGAYMAVELINDGPATFVLSSDHLK